MPHEDVRVVANDLEVYFNGFEVALQRKNIDDALRYLNNMKKEIDYNIESLEPIRNKKLTD